MAALSNPRDTVEIANGAKCISLPVAAATTIYQGAIVALDEDGFAIPAAKAEGIIAVGRAEETVENAGAGGALVIRVARGVFVYDNSGTTANKVDQADVMQLCYIEDDHTVTTVAADSSVAGRVIRVDDEGVAVELGSFIATPAAAEEVVDPDA